MNVFSNERLDSVTNEAFNGFNETTLRNIVFGVRRLPCAIFECGGLLTAERVPFQCQVHGLALRVGQLVESESHQTVAYISCHIVVGIVIERHFIRILRIGTGHEVYSVSFRSAPVGSESQREISVFGDCHPVFDDFHGVVAIRLFILGT